MASATNDSAVHLERKLTEDEVRELRITLLPYFHSDGNTEADAVDITDLLDYTFAMISNSKDTEYIVNELIGMEMDFCPATVAQKLGKEISSFIIKLQGGNTEGVENTTTSSSSQSAGTHVVSLKSSEEKGNALTMAGALGASREGGRNKDKANKATPEKAKADKDHRRGGGRDRDREDTNRKDRRENDGNRRDSEGKGGRGNRNVHNAAFERLAKGNDRRGRGSDRGNGPQREDRGGGGRGRRSGDDGHDRRRDDRGGRGTPGRDMARGQRDMGAGRGGRDGGRFGRGGRGGDRLSGNRRGRDDFDNEPDFVPAEERGGRGRGRGSGDFAKRPRYEEGYDNAHPHDEGHGGNGREFRGDGYDSHTPYRGGGRGRGGRFRDSFGRGRGRGYGHGFHDGNGHPPSAEKMESNGEAIAPDASDHPSPMVQASFGGAFGSPFGGRGYGRGFIRGGRGGGRSFPGRAQVVNMIQSKTWVRKKDGDNTEGGDASKETE